MLERLLWYLVTYSPSCIIIILQLILVSSQSNSSLPTHRRVTYSRPYQHVLEGRSSLVEDRISHQSDHHPWSHWSRCSRHCGGGITSRMRVCRGSNCNGATKQYSVCNVKSCHHVNGDFRSEQCSKRNGKHTAGHTSQNWIPLPGHTSCELKCKSVDLGKTFIFGKAEDGTKCKGEQDHVCLNGRCSSVGCDSIIGSIRVFDGCGVCGGHNSTCEIVRGVYNKQKHKRWTSDENYQEIVEIPAEAFNILVEDHSGNHLALQDSDGKFVINGRKIFGWPGTYDVDGTIANYSRVHDDEKFVIKGPLKRNVKIMALMVDKNPGIKYQYSVPKYRYKKYRNGSRGGRSYPVLRPHVVGPGPKTDTNDISPFYNEVTNNIPVAPRTNRSQTSRPTPTPGHRTTYDRTYRLTPPSVIPLSSTTSRPSSQAVTPSRSGPRYDYDRRRYYNNTNDRNRPSRPKEPSITNEVSGKQKPRNESGCQPCEKVKNRLKSFCTSDFVVRGKILKVEVVGKELKYDIYIKESFKTSLVLNPREYMWTTSTCKCPKLRKGLEYVIMAKVDSFYRPNEIRLVLDRSSFTRKFNQKREFEMMKLKNIRPEKCQKFNTAKRSNRS